MLQHLNIVFLVLCTATHPESASVMIGEKATFVCAGEEIYDIDWIVGGTPVDRLDDTFGQIEEHDELLEGGVFRSTLSIIGGPENDNVSIQCVLIVIYEQPHFVQPVFLTVLGKIMNSYMYTCNLCLCAQVHVHVHIEV